MCCVILYYKQCYLMVHLKVWYFVLWSDTLCCTEPCLALWNSRFVV